MSCTVENCKSKFEESSARSLHRFPSNEIRKNIWKERLNINHLEVSSNHRVCSHHFRAEDFNKKFVKNKWMYFLKDNVAPMQIPLETEMTNDHMEAESVLDMRTISEMDIDLVDEPEIDVLNIPVDLEISGISNVPETSSNSCVKTFMESCSKSECLIDKITPMIASDNPCVRVRIEKCIKAQCFSESSAVGNNHPTLPCIRIRVQTCSGTNCTSGKTSAETSTTTIPCVIVKVETCSKAEWRTVQDDMNICQADAPLYETCETADMEKIPSSNLSLSADMKKVNSKHLPLPWNKADSNVMCKTLDMDENRSNDSSRSRLNDSCYGFLEKNTSSKEQFSENSINEFLEDDFHFDEDEISVGDWNQESLTELVHQQDFTRPPENVHIVLSQRKRRTSKKFEEQSHQLAYYTTKFKKPYGDASKWVGVCSATLEAINHHEASKALEQICCSRFKIAKCLDALNKRAEDALRSKIQQAEVVSIALDETSDVNHKSQLIMFVRGVFSDSTTFEEMLDMQQLLTTKGQDVFNAVMVILEKYNCFGKVYSVTTDGAPAMSGSTNGFYGLLKAKIPGLLFVHCILHQENLAAQRFDMKGTVTTAIAVINKLRGGHNHMTHRLLRDFLTKRGAVYKDLLLGCNVRWLSNTQALERLFLLRKDVLDFIDTLKKFDAALKEKVTEPSFWNDVAFYCDITKRLCKLNVSMQGKNHDIFHHLEKVYGLIEDLKLLKIELLDEKLHGFPFCNQMKSEGAENFHQYSFLLESLIQDLEKTFRKFDYLKEYEDDPLEKKKLMSVFPTTYRCEAAFSTLGQLKSSCRMRLSDSRLTGNLRLALLDSYPTESCTESSEICMVPSIQIPK